MPREVPLLGRMALGYAELVAADLELGCASVARRLRAAVLCGVSAVLTLLVGLTWLIAASWDTPYRLTILGALTGVMFAITLVTGAIARSRGRAMRRPFDNVRTEWAKDREVVANVLNASPADARPEEP